MEQDHISGEETDLNANYVAASHKPYLKRSKAFPSKNLRKHGSYFHGKSASFFKSRKEYLEREKDFDEEVLAKFESSPTYPCHTAVYKSWLRTNAPFKSNGDSWLFIGIVAILMGVISFGIKHTVEKFYIFRYEIIRRCLKHGEGMRLWFYYSSISLFFSVSSSIIVVYVCPPTSGSGMPELMAILNGVVIRKMLSVEVLFWKIISSVMSILSTLPVGFEGPMIHIGSMVPTILTAPYKCCASMKVPENRYANDYIEGSAIRRWFIKTSTRIRSDLCRLRDGHERQVLACIGAASGVAAALNAPITGLCFSLEEMSSKWSNAKTWQTLFSCILACSTSEILSSVFFAAEKQHKFPIEYSLMETPIFDVKEKLKVGLIIMIPALLLGLAGGLIASTFIGMHLKITKLKINLFKRLNKQVAKALKIVDVFLITTLFTSLVVLTLPTHSCQTVNHQQKLVNSEAKPLELLSYGCNAKLKINITENKLDSKVVLEGEYHEVATLLLNTWEQLIRNLFSRRTPGFFSSSALTLALAMIFVFSSLSGSASLSGGLMIPQLAIGALYGRIIGQTLNSLVALLVGGDIIPRDLIDPGLFSLLGSASFFAGTSRLPITSVVMMIEMTNDVTYIFVIMISVLTAKYVGDCLSQSLYHSLMELKSMPFLDSELRIYWDNKRVNLEIFEAGDVMVGPVQCVKMIESVRDLASMLTSTQHGGFPVVRGTNDSPRGLLGTISRMEIVILLCNLDMEDVNLDLYNLTRLDIDRLHKMYSEYRQDPKIMRNYEALNKLMNVYLHDARYMDLYIDLVPYLDTSTFRIPKSFSLERTYSLFRQMGLRHLIVVDNANQVVGIITRKDLLEFTVEKRIHSLIIQSIPSASSSMVAHNDEEIMEMRADVTDKEIFT